MSSISSIEWTESTWNPVTGCSKISDGCQNCYAERMTKRLKAMGNPNYKNGFKTTTHDHTLELPLTWKKPRMIFANSMSDLFHKDVPDCFIIQVFEVMEKAHWHTFQILTKRSDRLVELSPLLKWTKNIWMGVTVESNDWVNRIDDLKKTGAFTKFISMEPLLGPIMSLKLTGIDWLILGGESGPGARPMEEAWATDIRDQCLDQNTPFFFKQWGGVNKKRNGRLLDNRTWDEMPNVYSMK